MRYRKLDPNGDYSFGRGRSDFWQDVPEAPAQAVLTRLYLFEGDWFLDLREGTPWNTQVLGRNTAASRDFTITTRVRSTEGVKAILSYFSDLNRDLRTFSVQMNIDTIYGHAVVRGPQ